MLTVTPLQGKEAPALDADITVHLADYGFSYSKPLTAGPHRLLVHDAAQQAHELVLVRLNPGKTAKDFMDWAAGGMKTAPPGSFVGGVSPLGPDGRNTALVLTVQ